MRRIFNVGVAAVVLAATVSGCRDFLKGNALTTNPNSPSVVTADQLFVGVQVANQGRYETYPYQLFPLWSQQISGVARQWITLADFGNDEFTSDGAFSGIYTAGGLVDIRAIEDSARAHNNRKFLGIARVYEALIIGDAADIWGDIPYAQALNAKTPPSLDPQASVFARVQAVLDSAILDLPAGGAGPISRDFVYNNDATKYLAAAHTLKARYYMHASKTAGGTYDAAALTAAKTQALLGINSAAGDWMTLHSSTTGEENLLYGFLIDRAGDIDPGATLVNEINAAGATQLLAQYFTKNSAGGYQGSPPDRGGSNPSAFAVQVDTRFGIVTYAENQMILAEAQFRLGDPAGALTTLNAYRASQGEAALAVTGTSILTAVLREKYIHIFYSPQPYFDYLRTCYPNLPLPAASKLPYIPARLFYGYTERITNTNIPSVSAQSAHPANTNYPKNLVDPTGAACVGQRNRP
ncbi:MAG: SusD/RagB family nutrient-binding outer membrane lipoprotein [Gemmatimonadota bacterium]|nr:SusD/RagB family nutrient-binding outer membrane lipoprotein [Gemmatimonadota bacterium]